MYNQGEEEAYLVLLDRHISETEEAIWRLAEELAIFEGDQVNSTEKLESLKGMVNGLELMREHRAEIASELRNKKE